MGMNYNGLQDYRNERLDHHIKSEEPELSVCFHDGEQVLDLVSEWHRKAMQSLRNCDRITATVVEIIENHVFYEDPQLMKDAKQLSRVFVKELKKARKLSEPAIPSSPSSGTQAMPFVVPAPQMAIPWRSIPDKVAKVDEVEANEVEEVDKVSVSS